MSEGREKEKCFNNYRCTNCGKSANDLFKKYKNSSVISLEICIECGKVVDSYIEYSTVIKLLDCCLLHPPVYRHFHYNNEANVKSRIKLFVISVIVESVCKLSVFQEQNNSLDDKFFKTDIISELLFLIVKNLTNSLLLSIFITFFSKLKFSQISTIVQQTSAIKISALPVLIWVEPSFIWIYDNIILMMFFILTTSFLHSINYDKISRAKVKNTILISAFLIYLPQIYFSNKI